MSSYRILLITPSTACVSHAGGGQRTNLVYTALKKIAKVDVILVGNGSLDYFSQFFPEADSVQLVNILQPGERGIWNLIRPIRPSVVDNLALALGDRASIYQLDPHLYLAVQDLLNQHKYDLIVGRYLRTLAKAGVLQQNSVPVILDFDDPDEQVLRSRLNQPDLNLPLRLIIQRHIRRTQSILPNLLSKCAYIWVTNQNDQQKTPHSAVTVLPNIPYSSQFSPVTSFTPIDPDSSTILFVGIYGHTVNRVAIKRFLLNQWANIRQIVSNAKLRIVGSGEWSELESEIGSFPGVEYVGFVEDLSSEYAQCRFTIVPIFEGGGTKIKVVESLYYGRTAVITNHAHYGYENLLSEDMLLVAHTESEFTQKCIQLLQDTDLCTHLAQQGQKIVQANYSYTKFESIVQQTAQQVISSKEYLG